MRLSRINRQNRLKHSIYAFPILLLMIVFISIIIGIIILVITFSKMYDTVSIYFVTSLSKK